MDKNFKEIARPLNLYTEQSFSLIHFFLMRFTPYITYFLVNCTKTKPNTISIISVICLILSIIFLFFKDYFLAIFFLLLNFVTDNVDGELARVTKQKTLLGGKIEKANSDIFYLLWLNTILFNFFLDNSISKEIFLFLLSISLLHILLRGKISNISLKKNFKFNQFNLLYLGLFKYSYKLRSKNLFSKIVYIFFF